MDIKLQILRWQHSVAEDPAMLVLEIIVTVAVIFVMALVLEGFIRRAKKKRGKRNKQ